jgi:CO/xanthine dehydrogenase Mo-binding subunit
MDITATKSRAANDDAAHDHITCASDAGLIRNTIAHDLNVECVTANPFLPAGRKWAIRFNAGRTVTIVLGMRDYGRGWYSAYFAGVLADRLGIPFQRVRVYYNATLPAVLQTPQPFRILPRGSIPGPVVSAAADVIENMCDRVIEKCRLTFAALAGVDADDIGFDQPTGRFYILDRDRSGRILEIAETVQGESNEFAKNFQRGGKAQDDPHPSAWRRNRPTFIKSILMYGTSILGSVLLALALSLTPADGQVRAVDRSSSAAQERAPTETLKERLNDKASDEQRVNNCKVPKERRDAKPRPEDCEVDQAGQRNPFYRN